MKTERTENRTIKAIIFDFDGVCIDTEHARFVSWENIYKQYGEELPLDEWIKNIGHASWVSDPFAILEKRLKRKLDREYIRDLHVKAEKKIADGLPLQPGLIELLKESDAHGIKCGIASSSSHRWVDGHLAFRDLTHYFSTVVCRDDTENHKPNPEPYLKALQTIGIEGKSAVAIEDSPTGIAAAKAAGMYTVAVPCSITKDMDFSDADMIIHRLSDITLRDIFVRK